MFNSLDVEALLADDLLPDPRIDVSILQMLEEALQILHGWLFLEFLKPVFFLRKTPVYIAVQGDHRKNAQHDCERSTRVDLVERISNLMIRLWEIARIGIGNDFVLD